jgi:DNA-binding beta-propeller fold protein YncE
VTPDGRSAYVADAVGVGVGQYDIDPVTGVLSPKSPASVSAGEGPSDVAVTPDGKSAYVTNANFGHGNTISQYDINPASGALTPKSPATVNTGTGPVFIAVTPDGESAYVTNFQVNSVSQYDVDPASGALTPKSPATIASGTQPVQIAVTTPPRVPTSKAQCKHGGWRRFGFKNQGQCIAFVNRH